MVLNVTSVVFVDISIYADDAVVLIFLFLLIVGMYHFLCLGVSTSC